MSEADRFENAWKKLFDELSIFDEIHRKGYFDLFASQIKIVTGEEPRLMTKTIFVELNGIIARNESLEWGVFRGEGEETHYTPEVGLGRYGRHTPHATEKGAPYLNRLFEEGVAVLERRPPFERALAFFLFGALHQFFFDGNKRTSRLMMNGILMSNGMDAISIPAARVEEFNEKMVDFYRTKDGTEMMAFLASCHPYWEEKMRKERSIFLI